MIVQITSFFGQFQPESIAVMIPIVALMIPIVAILVKHQQKMAEIVHQNRPQNTPELDAMRREMAELRQLVMQNTIQIDSFIQQRSSGSAPSAEVRDRLTGG